MLLNDYLVIILIVIFILLISKSNRIIKNYYAAHQLNILLEHYDIYILTNSFCRCFNFNIFNNTIFKINCELCNVRRVIDFENEKDVSKLLRKIKNNVNFIIHTDGGETDIANYLTYILKQNKINTTTYIPEKALSAGSFMALCSNIIHMNWYSCMGPIDTQLDYNYSDSSDDESYESYPAKFIKNVKSKENALTRLKAMEANSYHEDDLFILNKLFKGKKRDLIIKHFLDTELSHSIRYGPKDLSQFGLNISLNMPNHIQQIFDIFQSID